RQAAGKSTREVQQMLAEVDPELAQPSDRLRALGGGRWELKAAVDAECRHGLEKLLMLLSHRDPHLALGGLVARLVRDGLDRYDPARPPRPRRTGGRGSVDGEGSVSTPTRRDSESVPRNVVRANGSDVERQDEVERDDPSRTAGRDGTPRPHAPKRHAQTECDNTKSAPVRDGDRRPDTAAERHTEAEHGGTKLAVERGIGHCADAAPKRVMQDEGGHTEEAERVCADAASAPERGREKGHACGQPTAMRGSGGRAASPAKRQGRADGGCREAGAGGVLDRATCAAGPRFDADRRDAGRAPGRGGRGCPTSAAKPLACAVGRGAVGPAERSPALERHLATLHCFGALPGSRSRYIPAVVRREVWLRDQGCCSYVDPHSGRRCGSRYRLEIDHIVPFALGGPTELRNLRVRCRAHHRLRHAHAENVPTETRRAAASTVDPQERGQTFRSRAAIDRAGA
ncbi:MAG: HNH endonuclease signature motif containing protein, partial [Spirochaetaceae bacterium]|nr:HNH endonuclease signature motif containing protein [Spirochaetaceae bacterium]